MLDLIGITKDYDVADGKVHALRDINLKFRRSEFVSVLGPSGCGKTTLLNIIGGLDKYTEGDLVIEGVSTKKFTDKEWDTYRNHSVGFIFQSYYLIPHQTILQNVELALTIAGVGKEERRERAMEALKKVGLEDRANNRPNQLSGGQAQRVAIARALINDPEILLADEPTGALDSKTSVQIMDLLKEIACDRLVVMVTHNPELAEQYSTRIVRLLDGEVVDDTDPYDGEGETYEPANAGAESEERAGLSETEEDLSAEGAPKKTNKGKKRNSSMSMGTATALSFRNLLSKKGRTIMVAVAASVGIIGVSLVLAVSSGVSGYIDDMEDDMLSGYPITISQTALDYSYLTDEMTSSTRVEITKMADQVYIDSILEELMQLGGSFTTNNISEDYVNYINAMPQSYYNVIQYDYDFDMANYIYTGFTPLDGVERETSITGIKGIYTAVLGEQEEFTDYASLIATINSFSELPNSYEYILSQYDVLASYNGKTTDFTEDELRDMFESEDSLILVLSGNTMSDVDIGQFGYMTEADFMQFAFMASGNDYDEEVVERFTNGISMDMFVGEDAKGYMWYPNDTIYEPYEIKTEVDSYLGIDYVYKIYADGFDPGDATLTVNQYEMSIPGYDAFDRDEGMEMKVKVVLQKKEGISYGCLSSGMYYTNALTKKTMDAARDSEIVAAANAKEGGTLSMVPYFFDYYYPHEPSRDPVVDSGYGFSALVPTGSLMSMIVGASSSAVDVTMLAGASSPTSVSIYPLDFDKKDDVTRYLDAWNDAAATGGTLTLIDSDGKEYSVTLSSEDKITYTDSVGLIISMVNTLIDIVTVALICFTALALVVSTVMVGIITYVSVVERVKEIGILRSIGARKKDVSRLFNAETFIIGLFAGLVGILVTYILSLIINLIVGAIYGIYTICALPIWEAAIMVVVSVVLTLISGLIPASAAAKKDPAVALRTE